MVYFDANATTPLHPAAREAWLAAQSEHWQNAAAPTAGGVRAQVLLENCRARLAARLPAGMEIVFTSGATEANNAVFADAARHAAAQTGTAAASASISAVEHASVVAPAADFFRGEPLVFPVGTDGVADIAALQERLRCAASARASADISGAAGPVPAIVSLMAANNETGVLQPVGAAREIAHRHALALHCDASQAFGKLPAGRLRALLAGCDFVTGCAHKFGGPKGVGFLAFNAAAHPRFRMQIGGGHENRRRAGTVDVPAIAAMLAALEACDSDFGGNAENAPPPAPATGAPIAAADVAAAARLRFEARILAKIPGARVNGAGAPRVWNTVSLTFPKHDGIRWVKRLERHGFVTATGAACASLFAAGDEANADAGTETGTDAGVSRVLLAMGLTPSAARRTIRISAWREMPPRAWDALGDAILDVRAALDSGM